MIEKNVLHRRLSGLVKDLKRSKLRVLTDRVNQMGGINMGQGNNLLPTPQQLIKAANSAMKRGYNDYSIQEGIPELRKAISEILLRPCGIVANPEDELRITSGATGAFFSAAKTFLEPGTEAIVLEPFYPYHIVGLHLTGATIKYVRLNPPNWNLDLNKISQTITDSTRVLVLCNPCNPTGRVYPTDQLTDLVNLCRERGVIILCDEVYELLTYGNHHHVHLRAIPEAKECSVSISSFSKSYAITGWRVGYIYGSRDLIERITMIHDGLFVCAPRPFQHALVDALNMNEEIEKEIQESFTWRKESIVKALQMARFDPLEVQGTYYIMASYGRCLGDKSAIEACEQLLENFKIASVPVTAFYHDNYDPKLLRFCFALPEDDIIRAAQILNSIND